MRCSVPYGSHQARRCFAGCRRPFFYVLVVERGGLLQRGKIDLDNIKFGTHEYILLKYQLGYTVASTRILIHSYEDQYSPLYLRRPHSAVARASSRKKIHFKCTSSSNSSLLWITSGGLLAVRKACS